MATPIYAAIRQICEEKGLSEELVIETIEAALAAAYRKDFGQPNHNIKIKFNPETGAIKVWDSKIVVTNELKAEAEAARAAAIAARQAAEAAGLPPPPLPLIMAPIVGVDATGAKIEPELKYSPKLHYSLDEAHAIKADANVGDEIKTELSVPGEFGRMAAQTAKQVIIQKLREAERTTVFDAFKSRVGEVTNALVSRREGRVVFVDIGRTTSLLLPDRQIETENYVPGARLKVYIEAVNMTPKGPEILVSRTSPEIVRRLFTVEIPEVANKLIEIREIAREAGARSKVAVEALGENIDPIGSCVGQRGARIQTIIGELGGEKVDIIEYDADPKVFIMHALSPAKVQSVELDEENKVARVVVSEDQLSLAIGRGGQNVRLASRLTGWRIDIKGAGVLKTEELKNEETPASAEATEDKKEQKEKKTEEPKMEDEKPAEAAPATEQPSTEQSNESTEEPKN